MLINACLVSSPLAIGEMKNIKKKVKDLRYMAKSP